MLERAGPSSIAVVIPLYNKAAYIEAAIASALAQTAPAAEIIIVDDRSNDDGLARVRRIDDPRIRVLTRDRPGPGGYAARNLAIKEARSEWIAFLDADDLWRTDHLAHIQATVARYEGVAGVFVGYDNDYGARLAPKIPAPILMEQSGIPLDLTTILRAWLQSHDCPIWTGACAFQRSALIEAGLFPEGRASRGGDKDLWLRLAARYPLAFSSGRTAIFNRMADNKVTRTISTAKVPFICETIAALVEREERPEIRSLLRALANLEIALYARQTFANAPIPAAMRASLHMPGGWRDWLMIAGMEATPPQVARLVRRSLRGAEAAH